MRTLDRELAPHSLQAHDQVPVPCNHYSALAPLMLLQSAGRDAAQTEYVGFGEGVVVYVAAVLLGQDVLNL
jgi:hypothetical protein